MTPDFPYVQLPGSYRGFFRKASLWEGVDHILSVKGTRFNEEYRRFYYRDIQAFVVENRARAGSIGWWIVLLILLIISLVATAENDPPYSWVVLVAISVVLVVRLEITFRRSCRCSIQTAVSREPLPSLMRRTAAAATIARLEGRIAAEQGDLPAEIPFKEEDVAAAIRPADPARPSPASVLEQAAVRERRHSAELGVNLAILALFILLINSVFTFWVSSGGKLVSAMTAAWSGYSFIAVGLIPVFLSLSYIGGLPALKGLRALLVTIIVVSALRVAMGFAVGIVTASLVRTQGTNFGALFGRYYANTNGAIQFALAAGGVILIFAKWETYRRGEKSSS
jgi:hypothetical protein